jgi:endogenous inhibitor of DNA gyrase (YacG/DUF329 family)
MPMTVKCPVCRAEVAWEGNPFRPFCSERCKTLDLGAWLTESYRIPAEQADGPVEPDASASSGPGDEDGE